MKETEIINRVAEILGQSGQYAVQEYAVWHIVYAIGLIAIGLFLIYKGNKFVAPKGWDEQITPIIKGIMIFFGALFVVANLPDLFSPQAMAIHQLLNDIKP
jgi:hypothetical protein